MNKIALIGIIVLIIIILITVIMISPNKETTSGEDDLDSFDIEGVRIDVLKKGAGIEAKRMDMVTVHYTGWLESGEKFDSSLDRGEPFSFILGAGQVISGWDIGVIGMKVGEKRRLTIPSDLAYGDTGIPGGPIPPKATLIFEVELLQIAPLPID